ncbi:hypothetical protein, partial [Nocardiopsis lucentensis]|uniref:hypothetical protein n=1 Tax=Nocardiopsis lucentensis TaxID=53441 RepID=UPI0005944DFC
DGAEARAGAAGTALPADRALGAAEGVLADLPDGTLDLGPLARRLAARMVGVWLDVPGPLRPAFEAALTGCRHALDARWCPQTLAGERLRVSAETELGSVLTEALGVPGTDSDTVTAVRALAVAAAEPT